MAWLASLKSWFTTPPESAAAACYASLVGQARQPFFYTAWQVPDTPQGRFELVMLHAILIMRRLHDQPTFTQTLFDLMFADFDVNLRELGVGDLGVGKRVKGWAQAFKGRAMAYDAALAGQDDLVAVLKRNIFPQQVAAETGALASYIQTVDRALAAQSTENIMAGQISWPNESAQ